MKTIMTLLLTGVIAGAGVAYLLSDKKADAAPERNKRIVRLHTIDGRFFCSGSIINKEIILTAAHCIMEWGMFGPAGISKEPIAVYSSDGGLLGVGRALKANYRGDTGVIVLDVAYHKLAPLDYETDPQAIINSFANHKHILCGYPWGGGLLCVPIKHLEKYVFQWQGESHAWPGMSGGPVFDLDTGKIVATVSAGTEKTVIVSPLINLWDMVR